MLRSFSDVFYRTYLSILNALSAREIVGKSFFHVSIDVCVDYFVGDLLSGCRVEGLTKPIVVRRAQSAGFATVRSSRIVYVMFE